MKKLLSILTLCMGLCCVSCYDDSALIERIDALEKTAITSLEASISSLEAKDAELEASIIALEESGKATSAEIQTLKDASAAIEKKITELKEWVEKLIEGYYTKEEVDKQIESINTEIDALDMKLTELENKLNHLLRDFTISFDDSEIGILAGGTTSVGYTITGATEKTTVKALGQNGWSAKVTPDGTDKGKITVTAPNPMTDDEIIVLVYDGEYRTIMSSINFVTGIVTPSQTAVELEAEAGTVDITVTANLNYNVSIPDEAKDWLSVVETKATKTKTMTFAFTTNEFSIRRAEVSFVDDVGNIVSKISFVQQGAVTEVTLTEAGTLLSSIGDDTYKYIKSLKISGPINGNDIIIIQRMTNLKNIDLSDATIVSGGESLITQENTIPESMFSRHPSIVNILLPNTLVKVDYAAFAFTNIEKIKFPSSTKIIGLHVFSGCNKLSKIDFNEGLETIQTGSCRGALQTEIILPSTLKEIRTEAFIQCPFIKSVRLKATPETLKVIDAGIFDNNIYEQATLYIPKGTKDAYFLTDFGRFTNIVEE